jgi:hypothetical protein
VTSAVPSAAAVLGCCRRGCQKARLVAPTKVPTSQRTPKGRNGFFASSIPGSSKLISEENNFTKLARSNRVSTLEMLDLTRNSYRKTRLTGIFLAPKLRPL